MTENPLPAETVFLSYARKDLERITPILKAFEAHGWGMWVDRIQLQAGDEWQEKIRRAIANAYCVVVVWSKDSVKSEWVKKEAALALEKVGKGLRFFPVQIDPGIEIPEEFKKWHAGDLTTWEGDPNDPVFKTNVVTAVEDSWSIASEMALRHGVKKSKPLRIIKRAVPSGTEGDAPTAIG